MSYIRPGRISGNVLQWQRPPGHWTNYVGVVPPVVRKVHYPFYTSLGGASNQTCEITAFGLLNSQVIGLFEFRTNAYSQTGGASDSDNFFPGGFLPPNQINSIVTLSNGATMQVQFRTNGDVHFFRPTGSSTSGWVTGVLGFQWEGKY